MSKVPGTMIEMAQDFLTLSLRRQIETYALARYMERYPAWDFPDHRQEFVQYEALCGPLPKYRVSYKGEALLLATFRYYQEGAMTEATVKIEDLKPDE